MIGGPKNRGRSLAVMDGEDRNGIDTPHLWVDDDVYAEFLRGGDRTTRMQHRFNEIVVCVSGGLMETIGSGLPLRQILAGPGASDVEMAKILAENIGGVANRDRVLHAALRHARRLLVNKDGLRFALRVSTALQRRLRLERHEVEELMSYDPDDDDDPDLFGDDGDGVVVVLEDPVSKQMREQLRHVLSGSHRRSSVGAGHRAKGFALCRSSLSLVSPALCRQELRHYAEATAILMKLNAIDEPSARSVMVKAQSEGLAITTAEVSALIQTHQP